MIVLKETIKGASIDSTDIADSAKSVQDAIQLYNDFLQSVGLVQILENQRKLEIQEKTENIAKWLSLNNNWDFHDMIRKQRVPNTGFWFMEDTKFRNWIDGTCQVLISHGRGMFSNN